MVLLKRNLEVLIQGVIDGRRTFANTLKYISITTSANFGNMISMAIGALFLPFLPLMRGADPAQQFPLRYPLGRHRHAMASIRRPSRSRRAGT